MKTEWKWLLAALVILAAAIAIDSGLLAYAMYVLLGVMFLSRLLARDWLGKITATRQVDAQEAEVGDVVGVRVEVRNNGAVPVPWMLLEDLLPPSALKQKPPRITLDGKRFRIGVLRGHKEMVLKYKIECQYRGYYQIGPLLLESGDLFGLHRRHRVETEPAFLMVYPKIVALTGYDIASRRPIGDVRLTHRLYEDPTRIGGVRPYEAGDPMNRVHWRATARTGMLHSKVYEPTTLAGATILLDFHKSGYPKRGEPHRSELAVTAAASLANAVAVLGQQVGLATNGRDAADRLKLKTKGSLAFQTRQAARSEVESLEENERLKPQQVETRRGVEQFQRIRELLARVELTDGMPFSHFVLEITPRLPRDATVIAILPDVPVETAVTLSNLQRQGFAVSVVLVMIDTDNIEKAYGRLWAEGVRDVRHLVSEQALADLCSQSLHRGNPYSVVLE
ncbi:MAG: DUF58 domain-containing protein [Gemmataceae bacterium]